MDKVKYLLADFGTAVRLDPGQSKLVTEGDHRYLPPELREQDIGNDLSQLHKADVYALGLVALQFMTSNSSNYIGIDLPSDGDEWTTICKPQTIRSLLSQTDYSESLKEIVERCLNPDPRSRLDAAALKELVLTKTDSLLRVALKRPSRLFQDEYNSTPGHYASSTQASSLFELKLQPNKIKEGTLM